MLLVQGWHNYRSAYVGNGCDKSHFAEWQLSKEFTVSWNLPIFRQMWIPKHSNKCLLLPFKHCCKIQQRYPWPQIDEKFVFWMYLIFERTPFWYLCTLQCQRLCLWFFIDISLTDVQIKPIQNLLGLKWGFILDFHWFPCEACTAISCLRERVSFMVGFPLVRATDSCL